MGTTTGIGTPAPQQARRKRRGMLVALSFANLAFLIALWAAETFVAERHWLTTLATYAPQQIFGLATFALLVWAIASRDRRWIGLNAVSAAFVIFVLLHFNIPLSGSRASRGPTVRIVTYNIHHASVGASRVADALQRMRPDVVCLQEANPYGSWPDPMPELRRRFHGWRVAQRGQAAIFSRFPMVSSRVYEPPGETRRGFLEAVLSVNGLRLRVIDAHFEVAARPHSIVNNRVGTASYVRESTAVRYVQLSCLLRVAAGSRGPVVVAGDFNTPPRGLIYRRLVGRFRDAFRAAGWGFGWTFRADLPWDRIDYIFVGPGVQVRSCRVGHAATSDHRPVIAEVALAPGHP